MEKSDKPDLFMKTKEFLEIFKKGEEFTHDLLKENEQLRYKVVNMEEQLKANQKGEAGQHKDRQSELEKLREENRILKTRFHEVEAENRDFATRYVEVEEENNNLANLYVASYQLHSTLDFEEVIRIILEIVINLVGSDKFSILAFDETVGNLKVVVSEGIDAKTLKAINLKEGVINEVIRTGESYFESDINRPVDISHPHPIVCIPLKIKDKVIGALVIYSLLGQKKEKLTRVDYELFSMLAGHAATALFSSKLFSQSERKLTTIQGFLDLLSGGKEEKGS